MSVFQVFLVHIFAHFDGIRKILGKYGAEKVQMWKRSAQSIWINLYPGGIYLRIAYFQKHLNQIYHYQIHHIYIFSTTNLTWRNDVSFKKSSLNGKFFKICKGIMLCFGYFSKKVFVACHVNTLQRQLLLVVQ